MKKRVMALLLAALLAALLWPVHIFADEVVDSAIGTVFRLEKGEGELEVCNAAGKIIKLREGGKLYSGYEVTTKEGYAWLSLDADKLLKLDWNSRVILQRKGKQLEVLLDTGGLFFTVDKPLEEDETLDIRTSTMSTGIRGTMGIVSVNSQPSTRESIPTRRTNLQLLEGKVDVAYYGTKGALQVDQVKEGEEINVHTGMGQAVEVNGVPASELELKPDQLAAALEEQPFVLVELKQNEALAQRVEAADNGVEKATLEPLLEKAEVLLEEKQQQVREEMAQQEEQAAKRSEQLVNESSEAQTLPVFNEAVAEPQPTPAPAMTTPAPTMGPETPQSRPLKESPAPTPALVTVLPSPQPKESAAPAEPTPAPTALPVPTAQPVYTITFKNAQGATFALQKVESGKTVSKPLLQPGPQGSWHKGGQPYSFASLVSGSFTLEWVDTP